MTFTNCIITDRYGIRECNAEGDVVFDNCTIYGDVYGYNFSNVDGTVTFTNCDISGWNSSGGAATAGNTSKIVIDGCTFHKSTGYGVLRFYQDADVSNTTFDDDFEYLDVHANNVTVTITNCTGISADKIFICTVNDVAFTGVTITLDGTTLTNVQTH